MASRKGCSLALHEVDFSGLAVFIRTRTKVLIESQDLGFGCFQDGLFLSSSRMATCLAFVFMEHFQTLGCQRNCRGPQLEVRDPSLGV